MPSLTHLESTPAKCEIGVTLTTFRINTSKSVSKQRTLTLFRMNTYEKEGGEGAVIVN
jgi:hypothetical protein